MSYRVVLGVCSGLAASFMGISQVAAAADAPSVKLALSFRPVQSDVEYETPDEKDFDRCKVNVERQGKSSGWVVVGPAGQLLRRFVDTNGDNVVDQWRYFQHGVEVYRDIDSNFNNKVDQCRWLNSGGSRWGIDSNEDGKIDSWKMISAEEASREAIQALVAGDEARLRPLLISSSDLTALGISGDVAKKLLDNVSDPAAKMRKITQGSKVITPRSRWMRFDSAMPGIVPADQFGTKSDLLVYENVMAIVETGSDPGLVQIGEMIRVNDVWKLTRLPQPLDSTGGGVLEAGVFMQPAIVSAPAGAAAAVSDISPQVQKLIEELQELDKNAPDPSADRTALGKYYAARTELMQKLMEAAEGDEERDQWTRQTADAITAAIQTGAFPMGVSRLEKLQTELAKKSPKSPLVSYVAYRRLLADYGMELQKADTNEKRTQIQENWLKDLEEFVKKYPDGEDTAEAALQVAMTQEFSGKLKEAREWYELLINKHSGTSSAERAQGALNRLDLVGRSMTLQGAGLEGGTVDLARLKGKVVLVLYWATWCKPCTEDLPQIRSLYQTHRDKGFEIVGVNLDSRKADVAPYLSEHRVTWPQIFEEGSLESPPAQKYGIISLPTMFLVGRDGIVISRNISVADLEKQLPDLLKKD